MSRVEIAEVRRLLGGVLDDETSIAALTADSPLLGHAPELDSIALVNLVLAIEERWGVVVEDDELERSAFATVGALRDFIEAKLGAG